MSKPSVIPIHPSADMVPLGRFDLHDLDSLRLLLRGSSVVDWFRLHFRTREEVNAFLRVNELDGEDAADRHRLRQIQGRALDYLKNHLRYRIPEVIQSADIPTLFDYASGRGRRAYRLYACLTLKVMHIIHYVEAHELLTMLPISNAEVAILLHAKVERVVRGLLERGFPIVEFSGNTKTYDSTVSKLLAKKDTQAAQLFDRLRFRFIVDRPEDIPSLLIALTRELFPFNYVVPNQADNTLVDIDHMLVRAGNLTVVRARQDERVDLNEPPDSAVSDLGKNELSGPDYRVVNFVAEVPIQIDRIASFSSARFHGLGSVVFGTVEMQVVDRRTAVTNESGENRHSAYKQRQRVRVKERLERGKRKKDTPSELPTPRTASSGSRERGS